MEPQPVDPRWPKLMSLAVHEFRTPLTVVAGYIRMLLKDRGGPLNEQQRRLLEEAEKSCGRLSALLAEMSELGALEKGAATFNRSPIDLRAVIRDAVAALPEVPEREVPLDVVTGEGAATLRGDPVRLRTAFTSLIHALRREVVASPRLLIRESVRHIGVSGQSWIAIGDDDHIEELTAAMPDSLATFDEWRGGCGLSLAIARRVINAHGGSLWGPSIESKAAAVVAIPLDS
jgi:signal transduction histidine kinase